MKITANLFGPGKWLAAFLVLMVLWGLTNWWLAITLVALVFLFEMGFNYARERLLSRRRGRRA